MASMVLCASGNWTCDDGGCVDDAAFCNGIDDCPDASDEHYCYGGECTCKVYCRCSSGVRPRAV